MTMPPHALKRIDMHVHVGLLGDEWPHWGGLSSFYRNQIAYKAFLFYARIRPDEVRDRRLREETEKSVSECTLDHVVLLALDPPYDDDGGRRLDLAHVWAANEYVLDLRRNLNAKDKKVLFGASAHPYDPEFQTRVRRYVDQGAVLLKWLPSAQNIDLADDRVQKALRFLANALGPGKPLPLLLHTGCEYAIPPFNSRTPSYDFLSWSFWDRVQNDALRLKGGHWRVPQVAAIQETFRQALDAGAVIILAHAGTPYFADGPLGRLLEHSDFDAVVELISRPPTNAGGRCYADVSAFATPFRQVYFREIAKLPPDRIVYGSDFPTPVFELSADLAEVWKDFQAVMNGRLDRIVVPQDNLLDVHERELRHAFGNHLMFTNFSKLLPEAPG